MVSSTTSVVCGPYRHGVGTINLILIATLIGYAVLTLAASRVGLYSRPVAFACAGVCCFVGTFVTSVATHWSDGGAWGAVLECAGIVGFAAGNALLLLMWGERWSTLSAGDVGRQLYMSFACAFVLYFVIEALPVWGAVVCNALLGPVSACALAMSQGLPSRTGPVAPIVLKRRSVVVALACIVLFSFMYGTMQRAVHPEADRVTMQRLAMVVAGFGVVLFACVMTAQGKNGDPFSFYRPIVPTVVCGVLMSLMVPADLAFVGNGVLIAGIYCLDMFIMFATSDLAYRAKLPVALVFGTAIVAARTGTWAGTLFGDWFAGEVAAWGTQASVVLVLALACLAVVAGTVVFTERELRAIYQPEAQSHVPDLDERCEQIAQTAGLSGRELDVMRLLARGRSVSVISETLGIAQGTVKHHASNTYRKLGVYDRQGLIDVVSGGNEENARA
jgi:DNA-binding CsgD family transcriptional regulator